MTKKLEELRDLANEELDARLVDLRSDLAKERALVASGTRSEKPAKTRNMRRTIARILTIVNEKKVKEIKEKAEGQRKRK
ncbi:MAG: 50S ribosomal protein L29 [Candidatus Diapherotrites archaeon]|nr:50S ribosomal protein L29 [Candidatus Micrarchaeota archaeon]MBU1939496.1 50S ribosomal protein L29 [Candidatus Micrarchaeota archaeon]